MNVSTIAKFIIVLGVAGLLGGGVLYGANQPEKFRPSARSGDFFGGIDDIGNRFEVENRNRERTRQRGTAVKVMIAGAVVTFIGIGVKVSSKK